MSSSSKKILIVNRHIIPCGVDRSLINLLSAIDTKWYDVDLFLFDHSGRWLDQVPDGINILPPDKFYQDFDLPTLELLKRKKLLLGLLKILSFIVALIAKYLSRKSKRIQDYSIDSYFSKSACFFLPSISPDKTYDIAISYLPPHDIVLKKTFASKKICWIHTDYSQINVAFNFERITWMKYDLIVAPSEKVRDIFCQQFNMPVKKTRIFNNIISSETITKNAFDPEIAYEIINNKRDFNICSVGSLSVAKGFDIAIQICSGIINSGYNVNWYIIGEGEERKKLEKLIRDTHLTDNFILKGECLNPYPFINYCDIYIQPSRFEAKSISVIEAQILNKPVIVFDYPTAKEQVIDGFDGIIVPHDISDAVKKICDLLSSNELKESLINNLKNINYESIRPMMNFELLIQEYSD